MPLFKTAGLLCNKFMGSKGKVMLVKDTWLGNALSLKGQGPLHGLRTRQRWLNHRNLTENLDAYDSDCDDVSNAKEVLMANLSNYGSDVISEVPHSESYHNDLDNQIVHAIQDFEQTPVVDFLDNEITNDSNIILYSQYLQETQQATVQDTNLYAQQDSMILSVIEKISEQMINHRLNIDLSTRGKMIDSQMDAMIKEKLALKQQIDSLEQNLSNQIKEKESLLQTFTVFKNESKEMESKYMDKEIDLEKKIKKLDNIVYKEAQRIKPTLYDGSVISSQHAVIPVFDDEETLILEELKKHCISLELTMQPNQEIFQKDKSCNNQNALKILEYFENNDLKAQLQAKDTTICKLKEHIKSMRENDKEEKVKQDMDEIETINIETRVSSKEHCDSLIAQLNSKSMENADLKGQIQEKVFVTTTLQNKLRRLIGKNVLDNTTTITNTTNIALGMFKLDLDPLAPRLLKNRDAHIDYLKYTQEQELLVYVRDTCPNANKPSEKFIAVTPLNKVKKVKFSEPLTSSSNIHKQVESSKTPDSNTPVLPSTGLKSSTSARRSQPTCNIKNDRISQTPSSNMKNKVEVQLRRDNLSSNKKNRVKDPICDANVKHTMLNANSELIYVKCKQCMFDANHDVCFLDFVNDVNARSKSKSAKQCQQYNI
ncbi:hypothetical protein Tco_1047896 [Tanacetum coccineum]